MATLTATDYANQIVAQARVINPSFSGEVGTPERKIIDAVAQALAEAQVDLTGLAGALDIDSKYGSNLDRFTALFGFQRQVSVAATGFVTFSCPSAATVLISIPQSTVLQASVPDLQGQYIQYTTQAGAQIAVGQTTSSAVPITCTITGSSGNVAANVITQIVGTVPPGVTAVTNPNALTNGIDQESDNAFKTRFKNTWARNLSGTQSQYLAIAVSSAYTTIANVIGAQSRYQEYIQVPNYDDAGYLGGVQTLAQEAAGIQNQWTSAPSDIPYAKQVYGTTPAFIQDVSDSFFYRPGTDFQFNPTALLAGDALRDQPVAYSNNTTTIGPGIGWGVVTNAPIQGFPSAGALYLVDNTNTLQGPFTYNGTSTGPNEFINVNMPKAVSVVTGAPIYLAAPQPTVAPNFTFLNVTQLSSTQIPGLQALSPGDIVLSEFSYVSTSSRNDLNHGVTNAVDIYVNGVNDVSSSCVFLGGNASSKMITANPASPFYYENYRRYGSLVKRPELGNYITPLFNTPLDSLPTTISINNQNYYQNTHYWLVTDTGPNAGSIRSRDGIEWSATVPGDSTSSPLGAPTGNAAIPAYTGTAFPALSTSTPIDVNGYLYDANVVTLQANMEASRQITTDALVHRATTRYFQLDITVMFASTANPTVTNAAISAAVGAFFANQPFGAVIQLSDLIAVISQVGGVDNVRWSNDLPIAPDSIRVLETDSSGTPLHGAHVARMTPGTSGSKEVVTLYVAGGYPTGGDPRIPYVAFGLSDTFTLGWPSSINTSAINLSILSAASLQTALRATSLPSAASIIVTQDTRPTTNVVNPLSSFTITYGANGAMALPTVTNNITSSTFAYDGDFFLLDSQLPSIPTANLTANQPAGVTVRVRAQNTWLRPGLG